MRSRKSSRVEVNEQFEWPKSCHLSVFFCCCFKSPPVICAPDNCSEQMWQWDGGREEKYCRTNVDHFTSHWFSHTTHSTYKCGALIASCCSRDIYILYIVYYIEETKLVLIQYKTKSQGSQMVVLFAKWPSSLGLQHNTYYQHQLSNSVLRGLMSVDICVMFSMSSQNPILSI